MLDLHEKIVRTWANRWELEPHEIVRFLQWLRWTTETAEDPAASDRDLDPRRARQRQQQGDETNIAAAKAKLLSLRTEKHRLEITGTDPVQLGNVASEIARVESLLRRLVEQDR